MKLNLDELAAHLSGIRSGENGEENFKKALEGLARNLVSDPKGLDFIKSLLEKIKADLDLEALKEAEVAKKKAAEAQAAQARVDAEAGNFSDALLGAMQQQIPGLKTQAHFNLVVNAWGALVAYFNATFASNDDARAQAKDALNKVLDLAPQLANMAEVLEDHPEATRNPDFVSPPKQFTEREKVATLLTELSAITTESALTAWYADKKSVMDTVVSQSLRNELYDAIRTLKNKLSN